MADFPTEAWLQQYEEKKKFLAAYNDFNEYFSAKEIAGKKLFKLPMGNVNFPTGQILVCDPLVYLHRGEEPYYIKAPIGTFPIETLVVEVEEEHYRYVAVRIKFNSKKAVSHFEALKGNENLDELGEGEYFGFNVDAGLATIVDVVTRDAYSDFSDKWDAETEDENKNLYDDFFAAEFDKSYKENPQFQREGGDWINFQIPGTDLTVPMIQSGFGDGVYPVYFGFDENNEVCELVIQFIDIELAFADEDEDEE